MSTNTPSLRQNFSWMFVGNVLYAACLWGIISALTKLGSPETVGRFALASAVATPLMLFANLQLRQILATDSRDRFEFGEFLALRLFCLPVAAIIVAGIAAGLYSGPQFVAIVLFSCVRIFDGLSDILHGFVQKHERIDIMARSFAIKGVVSLILFVALFWSTHSLIVAMVGLVAAGALVFLFWDLPRSRSVMRVQEIAVDVRPRWNAARLKSLLWLSLPLGLAMLFIQLRNTIPRMILEDVRGEAELGIFAAMAYLIIVGNTVVMALSQSSIARLARAYADDDATRFVSVTRKLVMVGALLGAGGILIAKLGGELLLTLLYKEEYAQQGDVFLVVMLAGGIYYVGTMFGPPATAAGAYREQLVIQGVHSVVLLISGYLLIPEYGMMGAAWTMVGGGIWVAVAYGVTVWRRVLLMRARSAT